MHLNACSAHLGGRYLQRLFTPPKQGWALNTFSFHCIRYTCRLGNPEREDDACKGDSFKRQTSAVHVSSGSSFGSQCSPGDPVAPPSSSDHADREASQCQNAGLSAGVAMIKEEGAGLRKVREFILNIRPNEAEECSGPSWQELQLEPTPTLLPDLR